MTSFFVNVQDTRDSIVLAYLNKSLIRANSTCNKSL